MDEKQRSEFDAADFDFSADDSARALRKVTQVAAM